jgi:hypothetical protein
LSRTTGDVRLLASVGAAPRIVMLAARSFSIPGFRFKSPVTGLVVKLSVGESREILARVGDGWAGHEGSRPRKACADP